MVGIAGIEDVAQTGDQGDQEQSGPVEEQAEAELRRLRGGCGREAGCRKSQESEADEKDDGLLKVSFPHSGLLNGQLALGK